MAQRLVRKICKKCTQPYQPTDAEMHALSLTPEIVQGATLLKGRGCNDCSNTGNRGGLASLKFSSLTTRRAN